MQLHSPSKENDEIQIEFYQGNPVNIVFPKTVTLKISQAPPGIHEGTDSTYKQATLENGMTLLVPQFIKEGDLVQVEVETGKYLDRIKK